MTRKIKRRRDETEEQGEKERDGAASDLLQEAYVALVSGLLGVEAGQDAIDRGLLYQMKEEKVEPYNITVAEFTNHISILGNCLGGCGIKDEGLIVPLELGSENKTRGNILSADVNSLSYARTAPETLRVIYSTGDEHVPGGFLPEGGNGEIARSYLHHH